MPRPDSVPTSPRGSKRTDLKPGTRLTPKRIATGQRFGSSQQQDQLQNARRVQAPPDSLEAAVASTAAPSALSGLPVDLGRISAAPTAFPDQPLAGSAEIPPAVADQRAFKIDVLRSLAALPFASPEVTELLERLIYGDTSG